MQLLFGYIGLFNALFFFPVLLILVSLLVLHSLISYLLFSLSMNYQLFFKVDQCASANAAVVGGITLTGLFDNVISDYLWARAVVLTSPTVATIGMSITIPLGMVSDLMLDKQSPSILSGIGACMVLLGFVFLNINDVTCLHLVNKIQKVLRLPQTTSNLAIELNDPH